MSETWYYVQYWMRQGLGTHADACHYDEHDDFAFAHLSLGYFLYFYYCLITSGFIGGYLQRKTP